MNPCERLSPELCAIFLFHGVITESPYAVRNYTRKHLPASEFRTLVSDLRAAGTPLSMNDILRHSRTKEPYPARSFAVTFDDGFANNLTVAAPILRELDIPATLYVTTGFVEENGMSWIDRVEHCLERIPSGTLSVPWSSAPRPFASAVDKRALLSEIRSNVKSDPELDVNAFVSSVFRQCGLAEIFASDDQLDRKLNWGQVRVWRDMGFIVGGHSHTHAILSFLDQQGLDREIDVSLRLLRRAGVSTEHYSYPEGLAHCYSDGVIAALQLRGIACCPTAEDGLNAPGADPFRLKRIMVA